MRATIIRRSTLLALIATVIALVSGLQPASAQQPEGVTEESIAAGAKLYSESGCQACHGAGGIGMAGMTKDLTQGEYAFVEGGTFDALVAVIKDGVPADKTGGMPMPAGANLTDEQARALAAYLWSLKSHGT